MTRTSPKTNRQTTVESLYACFQLIVAKDKESYCKAYCIAMHENAGGTSWHLMNLIKHDLS